MIVGEVVHRGNVRVERKVRRAWRGYLVFLALNQESSPRNRCLIHGHIGVPVIEGAPIATTASRDDNRLGRPKRSCLTTMNTRMALINRLQSIDHLLQLPKRKLPILPIVELDASHDPVSVNEI